MPLSSLCGFAPGGVYHADAIAGRAVRSCRTFSPWLRQRKHSRSGLFSVALSLGSPPPDVIRHRCSMEPGLSSAPKSSGHPADWLASARLRSGRGQAPKRKLRLTSPALAQPRPAFRLLA